MECRQTTTDKDTSKIGQRYNIQRYISLMLIFNLVVLYMGHSRSAGFLILHDWEDPMNQSKGKASTNASRSGGKRKTTTNNKSNNKGKPKGKGKPKSKTVLRASKESIGPLTRSYINTLSDPFEHSAIPLGFGALVPTRISTLYIRTSVASNADGTLALMVYPNAKGILQTASGLNTSFATTAIAADAFDLAAINANAGSGRVVSMGIKAYPNLAATAVPGQTICGAIAGSTFTLSQALTTADLVALPSSHIGKGYEGGVACSRPQDTDSFEFYPQVVGATGFATTTQFPCSVPYVAFTGIGNATSVFIEVVVNIEYIEALQHGSAPMGIGGSNRLPTLASEWNNIEHLWSSIRDILPDPGRIGYDTDRKSVV